MYALIAPLKQVRLEHPRLLQTALLETGSFENQSLTLNFVCWCLLGRPWEPVTISSGGVFILAEGVMSGRVLDPPGRISRH